MCTLNFAFGSCACLPMPDDSMPDDRLYHLCSVAESRNPVQACPRAKCAVRIARYAQVCGWCWESAFAHKKEVDKDYVTDRNVRRGCQYVSRLEMGRMKEEWSAEERVEERQK